MSTPSQIDLARRAMRGERALKNAGYLDTTTAAAVSLMPSVADDPTHTVITASGAGTFILVPGAPGLKTRIFALVLYLEKSQTWELFSGTRSLTGPMVAYPAGSGFALNMNPLPHWILDAGADLKLTLSATGAASGFVLYRQG